jgi:hypothetical protein
MLAGYVDVLEPGFVAGWAADTVTPEAIISVIIYLNDRRVATVPCDRQRPDLHVRADLLGYTRHGFHYTFSPPLDFNRACCVNVRFASSAGLLPNGTRSGGRNQPLSPILVTAPARSGTTFLMHRLSQSANICLVETQPFEVRLLAYWSAVYRTLTGAADFEKSTHPDRPEGDGFRIGSNPYAHEEYARGFVKRTQPAEYFSQFVPHVAAEFVRTVIDEFYLRLRDDQGKQDATKFAEKCNSLYRPTRRISRLFYPNLKEIIIIRDPRDIFSSRLAYFHHSAERTFEEISEHCRELMRIRRDASGSELFVRYEDMIADGPGVFGELSNFLGVADLEHGRPERENAVFRTHATSKSPLESIGRWKELPIEQSRRCTAAWAEFIEEFGYER